MTKRQIIWTRVLAAILVATVNAGCGTISSNTVQLSVELTNRIKDIEASHRGFVNAYFDSEIERVDKFITEKWTPLFLRNFLGTSRIMNDLKATIAISETTRNELQEAAKSYLDDPSEAKKMITDLITDLNKTRTQDAQLVDSVVKKYVRAERMTAASTHLVSLLHVDTPARIIMDFAEDAHLEIRNRRDSLVKPIELARKRALDELAVAYQDFYAGQGVITGRLEAAAQRSAEQAKLVDSVAGEGTAAKLNKRLVDFSADFNSAFSKMDKYFEKYNIDKNAKDGGASQIIDTFKIEINKVLEKHNLK